MNFNFKITAATVAVGSLLLVGACATDGLEEEPFGNLVPGASFGGAENEFLNIIAGAYTEIYRLQGNHNSLWSMNEVSTDELIIPQRGVDWEDGGQWFRVHTHTWNDAEDSFNNAWNKLYGGIANFTQLIDVTLPTASEELAAQFTPEVRGLRALYYYYLIDNFGNVPIIETGENAEVFPSTRSRQEVFAYIESELLDIIPALPEEKQYARITRDVAEAILAKLYLNAEVYTGTARYADAIARIDNIINRGNFELEDDYFFNFDAANQPSRENIFVIPYDRTFGRGFNIGFMTLHYGSQATFNMTASPWNGYASLQEFYDSYDDDDLRKGTPGNQQIRGNFIAGDQFAADGTTRILDPGAEDADPNGEPLTFTPQITEIRPNALRQEGVRLGKYEYEDGTDPEGNNDYPIFRYGDLLLNKAECLLRTNGDNDQEAIDLVNMVRDRAFEDGSENESFTEMNLDMLLAERGREMIGEYYRRQDMIRFGQFTSGTWQFKDASEDFRNLFPIPFNQTQANPNLTQNPGY